MNRELAVRVVVKGGGVLTGPGWEKRAECRPGNGVDPLIFFPDQLYGARVFAPARRVCRRCPVQGDCLLSALSWPEDPPGMWGGTLPLERKRLRAARWSRGRAA